MDEPLDDAYLTWLYSQFGSVRLRNRARSYWRLARVMYAREFVWFVPNDDNRAEDGRELRIEFFRETGLEVDRDWMDLACSFLEMLVAISRRLAFEGEGEPRDWFWHLMDNLELRECNDRARWAEEDVEAVMERVIFRTYNPDGSGGLFPLRNPQDNQRNVELWYQMSAYLLEHLS